MSDQGIGVVVATETPLALLRADSSSSTRCSNAMTFVWAPDEMVETGSQWVTGKHSRSCSSDSWRCFSEIPAIAAVIVSFRAFHRSVAEARWYFEAA